MVLPHGRVYNPIVDISSGIDLVGTESDVHQLLDHHWGFKQSDGKDWVLPVTRCSVEGSLGVGRWH